MDCIYTKLLLHAFIIVILGIYPQTICSMNPEYSKYLLPPDIMRACILPKDGKSYCSFASTCKLLYQDYKYIITKNVLLNLQIKIASQQMHYSMQPLFNSSHDNQPHVFMSDCEDKKSAVFIDLLAANKISVPEGLLSVDIIITDNEAYVYLSARKPHAF